MRKAQIKMGETIAVLVVFFMLIMVGLVIYTHMREQSIEKKRIEEQELKGVEIATRISQLPDIRCDRSMCIGCTDAVDILKLETFLDEYPEGVNNPDPPLNKTFATEYFNMFGESTITINMLYPDPSDQNNFGEYDLWIGPWGFHTNWVIYNRPPKFWKAYKPIYVPINLYNAFSDECYFGVMNVSVYEQ